MTVSVTPMGYKWLVLWSLWAARLVRQPTTPVLVGSGWLRGSVANDGSHEVYYGIPYATVRERFQGPGPAPIWEDTFEAVNEHIRCAQRFTKDSVKGTEDCLTINVYTPLQKPDKLYPVMVFIHGGGFRDGSGSPFIYGAEYLIEHEVVVVSFNYRLEVLGFLCLGIKEAPGNVGLKDQVEALKWVKRNIKAFGGDPDNITIFGESAGSASVMYHIVSPMSKGLFHRAILQSGSAISYWSLQMDPLKIASQLAEQIGYKTVDPYELYNIFKDLPAEKLLKARVPRTKGNMLISENIFVPCVEKKIDGIEQFLPDTPYNLVVNGQYYKVPVIIGHNNAEGYMFTARENETMVANMNIYDALPRDLMFTTEEVKVATVQRFKDYYLGVNELTKETLPKFSFFQGDASVSYPSIFTTDLLLKSSGKPVYSYKFSYDGWMNVVKFLYGFRSAPGATHADELFYMFKLKLPLVTAFIEKRIIKQMTTMWTNFAKYSDPTPEITPLLPMKWEAARNRDPKLFVIDKKFSIEPLWYSEVMVFWNETYTKYRRKT
ncbi:esterase FE4 [Amyelois transitella]|uniref:esterase FE4 n=1 Tax=Amyelois transitella TaxID=680683 RepID=UPI00067D4833|nr:esterase FE4 [Amyelois transitella]